MKCNYCHTTIPEGDKICNGCGKKVTFFTSENTNNNVRIINNYNNQKIDKSSEIEKLLIARKNNIQINVDKHASTATLLSIMGFMFMPFGIILELIALSETKKITNEIERQKTLKIVKILFSITIIMLVLTLLPILLKV